MLSYIYRKRVLYLYEKEFYYDKNGYSEIKNKFQDVIERNENL